MKKLILVILVSLGLGGCATMGGGMNYNDKMNTWIGHGTEELVQKWGYPTGNIVGPTGNLVYVYQKSSQETLPSFNLPPLPGGTSFTVPGETYVDFCNTYFEIDQNKTIVMARWQGNACR